MALRRTAGNYSAHFVSFGLLAVAQLVSIKIWTRFLSTEQYGLLVYYTGIVGFLLIASKLGLQHSALRFYSDTQKKEDPLDARVYHSTMAIGGIVIGLMLTGLLVLVAGGVLHFWEKPELDAILVPAAVLVAVASSSQTLMMFMRAKQQAALFGTVMVVQRYGQLALALLLVVSLGATVQNIFWGRSLAAGLIMIGLLAALVRRGLVSPRRVSRPLLGDAIRYGFPMVWVEAAIQMLSMGDRLIMKPFLGAGTVGIYNVAYATAFLGQSVIEQPVRASLIPIYLNLWAREGEEATRKFLAAALRYYSMVGIPTAIGLAWFAEDIVLMVSGPRFVSGYGIIPYIVGPMIMYGAYCLYGAGLYIKKKPRIMMTSTVMAAAVSVTLNLMLIPRFGIYGAAAATVVAYLFLSVVIFVRARPYFVVPVDVVAMLKYAVVAVAATWLAATVLADAHVVIKIGIVFVLYCLVMLAVDRDVRNVAKIVVGKVRGRG
jgi:O-antigen/teichoic acid export membrane protein